MLAHVRAAVLDMYVTNVQLILDVSAIDLSTHHIILSRLTTFDGRYCIVSYTLPVTVLFTCIVYRAFTRNQRVIVLSH